MAFSTSGCRMRLGTSASSVSGCTSKRTTRRSAKRVCSISRYFDRKSSSAWSAISVLADVLERQPEQVAQPHERAIGGLDVAVHQRRDGVQRVEEEVRVELLLERLELGFDEPRLELRRAQRPVLRFAVVEDGVAQADDRPVGHHFPVEVEEGRLPGFVRPGERPALRAREPPLHARHRQDVRQREEHHRGQVDEHRAPEPLPLEPEVLGKPDDRRREERPQVPVGRVQDHEPAPVGRALTERSRELPGQQRREQRQQRRRHEDDRPVHAVAQRCHRRHIGAGPLQIQLSIGWRFHESCSSRPHTVPPRSRSFVRTRRPAAVLGTCLELDV